MTRQASRRTMRGFTFLWMLVSLGGCSTNAVFDSDTPVSRNYVLHSLPASGSASSTLPIDLAIARPEVAPGLDTDRIAVLRGRELDYYRGVRWSADTQDLLQALVVDSLQDQRLFRSVTPEQSRVAGDYALDLEVRDFQAEYVESAAPSIRVSLVGRVIRVFDRRLVATLAASASETISEERMSAITQAFERATHQVLSELAQQTSVAIGGDAEALRKIRE